MTGAAVTKYEWTLNGTVVATTATYEVPAIAKSGDRIKLTVTAEDGETASDSVYVGGFSILKVEPTTAMVQGQGSKGYKYIRATFSNALNSLSKADIEIRNVKTEQLYSVEDVALSTDGYTADITIAGDAAVAGTTFLMPSTIYSCKMSSDGLDATLEFQLPDIFADMLVTSVDIEKNTITVTGSVRQGGQQLGTPTETFNVGDTYDGNLGELVGRTIVIGTDADRNITSLKVNDGEVAFSYVTAKDGDDDGDFDSSKDYFETASGAKYYLSESTTTTTNATYGIWADNGSAFDLIGGNGMTNVDVDDTFEYGKLVLNQNGTVSAAVLLDAFEGHIVATEAEGSVAKETSNNSKDFKGYTVIDGFTFDYVDPASISDGDIIYYGKRVNKVALIYNDHVTGTLSTVYDDQLTIDGTKYKYIVWTAAGRPNIAKNARYYDADADEYKAVTEKWAKTLDKTEDVTIFLDTHGDGVLVDGTVGETVTHTKDYIITKSPKAYMNGLSEMMDMSVSDGTEVTLHIAAADITSINGDAFGDVTFGKLNDKYVFNITDQDGKKTKVDPVTGKKTPNGDDSGSDAVVSATKFQQGGLVTVTYNADETKVTGLALKLGAQPSTQVGTPLTAITEINMLDSDKVSLKPDLTSIKTKTGVKEGSLTLSGTTKVYVITGTAMKAGELENDTATQNDTNGAFKEATDNKVKVYDYSDFDQTTKTGDAVLKVVGADHKGTGNSAITVASRVRFVTDKTAATAIVIDNRGINNAKEGGYAKDNYGQANGATDIVGGGVFTDPESTTKILGVATSADYQLNSDGTTKQLAALTILTSDGAITLDSFKDKLDTDTDIKNKIVLAELDASGKVQAITEGEDLATAPEVDKVNYSNKVYTLTPSTDTITVTTAADGNFNLKADTDCLVVKFDGNSYTESSIGDINRDTDYDGIKFWTSQLNGKDVKATVIVAVNDFNPNGYAPTFAGFAAPTGTVSSLKYDSKPVDPYGVAFSITGNGAATVMKDSTGTASALKVEVATNGLLTFSKTGGTALPAGTYVFGYADTAAGKLIGITATVTTALAAADTLTDSALGTITINPYEAQSTFVKFTSAGAAKASDGTTSQGTIALADQYGLAIATPDNVYVVTATAMSAVGSPTGTHGMEIAVDNNGAVTLLGTTDTGSSAANYAVGDKVAADITLAGATYTATAECAATGNATAATWTTTIVKK